MDIRYYTYVKNGLGLKELDVGKRVDWLVSSMKCWGILGVSGEDLHGPCI